MMELDCTTEIIIDILEPDDAESLMSSKASSNVKQVLSSANKKKQKKISALKETLN